MPKQIPITREFYETRDYGPFIIYVELLSPSSAESSLEELNTGTTLHTLKFGAFLYGNNFKAILSNGIKEVGRNRLEVSFKSAVEANAFIKSNIFANKYKTYIP